MNAACVFEVCVNLCDFVVVVVVATSARGRGGGAGGGSIGNLDGMAVRTRALERRRLLRRSVSARLGRLSPVALGGLDEGGEPDARLRCVRLVG